MVRERWYEVSPKLLLWQEVSQDEVLRNRKFDQCRIIVLHHQLLSYLADLCGRTAIAQLTSVRSVSHAGHRYIVL